MTLCMDCRTLVGPTSLRCRSCAAREHNRRYECAALAGYCGRCGGPARLLGSQVDCAQHCPRERQFPGYCALDGALLSDHPRCGLCDALCGPSHTQRLAGATRAGVPVCDACAPMLRRRGERALVGIGGGL